MTSGAFDSWTVTYLNCEGTELNCAIGRKVLIAACRRARSPGCKFDNITVLESPEGWDKSTAIRTLAGDDFFSDQSILGASDKEVQEQLAGVWMHECADLTGLSRADVEHVKAFASRQTDRARPAYGRVVEKKPRRSIEWASTNDTEYLQSQTGNRRFWPLPVGHIDIEALSRDRLQLLGEAAKYESDGESIILDKALWPDAEDEQEKRRVKDPWEDIVEDIPDIVPRLGGDLGNSTIQLVHCTADDATGHHEERVASADLLLHLLRIPAAQQKDFYSVRLAKAMKRAGWQRSSNQKVTINGKRVRGYFRRVERDDQPAPGSAAPSTQRSTELDDDIPF
jgi:predicted P-loop ATPase